MMRWKMRWHWSDGLFLECQVTKCALCLVLCCRSNNKHLTIGTWGLITDWLGGIYLHSHLVVTDAIMECPKFLLEGGWFVPGQYAMCMCMYIICTMQQRSPLLIRLKRVWYAHLGHEPQMVIFLSVRAYRWCTSICLQFGIESWGMVWISEGMHIMWRSDHFWCRRWMDDEWYFKIWLFEPGRTYAMNDSSWKLMMRGDTTGEGQGGKRVRDLWKAGDAAEVSWQRRLDSGMPSILRRLFMVGVVNRWIDMDLTCFIL